MATLTTPSKRGSGHTRSADFASAFALIFTSFLFTGSTHYPWPSLAQLRWFQVLTAANPITYVSKGMRAALVSEVPHIPGWIGVLALVGSLGIFGTFGLTGFRRRAVD